MIPQVFPWDMKWKARIAASIHMICLLQMPIGWSAFYFTWGRGKAATCRLWCRLQFFIILWDIMQGITVETNFFGISICFFSIKLSWIRQADSKILTVGDATFTSDVRFSALLQHYYSTLRIKRVKISDEGTYICHINTEPAKNFLVHLKVTGMRIDTFW